MGIWFEMLEYAVGVGGHCIPHANGGGEVHLSLHLCKTSPPPDLVAANVVRAADQKK